MQARALTRSRTGAARRGGAAGDLWGGLASMLVALPSSVAFGVAVYAALGPAYVARGVRAGILGAIAMGLVAPLLGGAPRLISAPCAPAAAVLGSLCAAMVAGGGGRPAASPESVASFLVLVALASGTLQVLYGLAGGGRLIKYLPYPVVSGYLSGVGVLIVASQLPKALALPKGTPLWAGLLAPSSCQWPSCVVSAATIAGVLVAPRLTGAVPPAILGLGAGLAAYFGLGAIRPELRQLGHNPFVIGPIAGGAGAGAPALREAWGALAAARPAELHGLLVPALTLSVLLSIDTLKTCVVLDVLTRSRHDGNRELLGQGAANVVSAIVGGMPGSGTMGATLVNVNSGGRTRLGGVLEGALVLVVFLAFGNLIGWVPIAALAGLLLVVAFRMIDWRSVHLLRERSTVLDFVVIAAVVVVAVGWDLIAASGTGLGLAILLFIREQARGTVIRRKLDGGKMTSKQHRLPAEQALLEQHGSQVTICELQGSLFFGTTDQLFTELEPDLKSCRYLILDMRRVQSVDFTAAHMLEQFEAMLKERGGYLVFSRLPESLPTGQDLRAYFAHVGVTGEKENVRRFDSLDDALQWVEDRILDEVRPHDPTAEAPLELSQIDLLREFEADQTLSVIASCVSERSYEPGQAIFHAGDAGDELYLVRRGIVRIVLPLPGSHHNLASFGRGDFFGEVAFLDRGKRSADAIATTPTDLFVMSRARFDEAARPYPLVGVKVFARIARALALRLRHTDAELRGLYES